MPQTKPMLWMKYLLIINTMMLLMTITVMFNYHKKMNKCKHTMMSKIPMKW